MMGYQTMIFDVLERNNGIITSKDCMKLKIPSVYLTRMLKNRRLEKVERGVYSTSEGDLDDYYFFQTHYSKAVYSFQSALYLHNMTDRIPFEKEITLYKGYNPHSIKQQQVELHFVKKKIYEMGIMKIKTPYGNEVNVYDPERTICDLIQHRSNIDCEIFRKALHCYLQRDDKNIPRLYEYANNMNIHKQLDDIMVLLNG